jgi:hypothetical protein
MKLSLGGLAVMKTISLRAVRGIDEKGGCARAWPWIDLLFFDEHRLLVPVTSAELYEIIESNRIGYDDGHRHHD